jgi:hypothetical protein
VKQHDGVALSWWQIGDCGGQFGGTLASQHPIRWVIAVGGGLLGTVRLGDEPSGSGGALAQRAQREVAADADKPRTELRRVA